MNNTAKSAKRYSGWRWKWLREGRRFVLLVAAAVLVFRFVIGFSVVDGVSHIERGYVKMEKKLSALNADVIKTD